jgi:LacI family gluconate utilization system Gnt-I transcriptional repressor
LDILRYISPTITSVRIPRYEIGKRSAELLLDRANGSSTERQSVDLKFEIIQREST